MLESARGAVALALQAEWKAHAEHLSHLVLYTNPASVRVSREYKAGKLTLVAASQRIDKKQPTELGRTFFKLGMFKLGDDGDCPLYMGSHFVPPANAKGEPNKNPWVAPAWWVTDSEESPNMVVKCVTHTVHDLVGVNIPVMVNKVVLKEGDTLTWNSKSTSEPAAKRQRA